MLFIVGGGANLTRVINETMVLADYISRATSFRGTVNVTKRVHFSEYLRSIEHPITSVPLIIVKFSPLASPSPIRHSDPFSRTDVHSYRRKTDIECTISRTWYPVD